MSLVGEHMSLVIHDYLVGICNSLLVEEHISLGICVSLVGEHMSLVIWERGRHISRDMCFLGRGTHITRKFVFPWEGNCITKDMCFPAGGEHISPGKTYH